ncbi:hypothetical protein F5050DRAFT_1712819 [Lentinula boryana]|uniref:Uncharacterized protein n=1 Tax=Lentinula boryana TaxID=40481 RepID=A0ABQ8QAT6_9AGAR|nr:hypothetical protein F5050DRAFT_1712819 [Lentinula boryana]
MYNSNGEEIVDEDDVGPSSHRHVAPSDSEEEATDRKGKGEAKLCTAPMESNEEDTGGKGKVKARAKADKGKEKWVSSKSSSCKVQMSREDMDVSSEEESDGQSALCKIEEVEQVQYGPKSNTCDFWTECLVTEKGKLKWEFKCKCCIHKVTVRQFPTTDRCNSFDEERPKPNLSNLTTHLNQVHPDHNNTESPSHDTVRPQTAFEEASTAFLQYYINHGKLNPKIEATQKGFLQMFSAWVFKDGLPFMTGKSKGL